MTHYPDQTEQTPTDQSQADQSQTDKDQVQALLSERIDLVSQLTELNARHIKAEMVRSGLEIEIAGLETNPPLAEATSTIPSELGKLKEKYHQQLNLQKSIDTERDDVTRKLDKIAGQLDTIY